MMANGTNGNGAMERAAESAALKFFARWMMVAGLPVIGSLIIGAGAWFANRVITATDENTKATIKIEATIAPLVKAQDAMQQAIEAGKASVNALENRVNAHVGRHDSTDKRLDGLDQRNREQDSEIRDIQRRVWRMPELGPATPSPQLGREPFEPYPPATRPR